MPTPRKNESKDHFMSRCIPEVMGEGYKQDQAIAICAAKWEDKPKKVLDPKQK